MSKSGLILCIAFLLVYGCSTVTHEEISDFRNIAVFSTFGQTFYGNYAGKTFFHNKEFDQKLPGRGLCPVMERAVISSLKGLPIKVVSVSDDKDRIIIDKRWFALSNQPDIDAYLMDLKSRGFDGFILIHSPAAHGDFIMGTAQNLEELGLYSRQIILDRMTFAYATFSIYFYNLNTGKKYILKNCDIYRELYCDPWSTSYSEIPLAMRKKILANVAEISGEEISSVIHEHVYPKKAEETSVYDRLIKRPYEALKYGERPDYRAREVTPNERFQELYTEAIENGEHLEQMKQAWGKR